MYQNLLNVAVLDRFAKNVMVIPWQNFVTYAFDIDFFLKQCRIEWYI